MDARWRNGANFWGKSSQFLGEKFTIFGGKSFAVKSLAAPLDYLSWSLAMIQVCCQKASIIAELTAIVEDVAATAPKEMIHDAVGNIRKRCQACQMAEGSQYEPFLKKI